MTDAGRSTTRRSSQARTTASRFDRWLPGLVVAFGIVSVALLLGTNRIRQRATTEGMARLQAIDQIEVDIAIVHLWIEEYVSGDLVDLAEIDRRLRDAQAQAQALVGGGVPGSRLPIEVHPPVESELRDRAASLASWLTEFASVSQQRRDGFLRGEDVGIGSAIDRTYDAIFAEVLQQTESLGDALAESLHRSEARSSIQVAVIVSAWALLVAVAAFALWAHERRRRRLDAELADSRMQLQRGQRLEAVGRLAGGLAHDINNYLAAIRGHCELVRMKSGDRERVEAKMNRVVGIVNKASSLIERLQTFSQRRPVTTRPVAVGDVIDDVSAVVRPTIGEDLALAIDVERGLWPIEADPSQIEQVLVNLLVNARDAMPTGGKVTLVARNVVAAHSALGVDAVRIRVADDGPGIAPDLLERIFEPYVTTRGGRRHSGLGLSIVYGVVRQHGGRIDVRSSNQGATFTIELPRSHRSADIASPEPTVQGDRETMGDERILLVDDNEDFRTSTYEYLQALGYRVTTAADAAEALAAVARAPAPFDLVLTDVVMPGLDGRQLVERLRAEAPIRAIFVSGYSEQTTSLHGLDAGSVHLIKGQFTGEELAATVRHILDA